ncbi:BMC domain-containing protein [Paenibacillus albiflavus]|uniref:BMC domain-containing protein n=1 Tax=Paenibacillus albiflavus TaxID=2545760 RepID=A0A4R4EKH0_9BACL|nr:BMC domain-containing protein [Paenibacillus albiflavus]TCZ78778.1 BMC domain-containing protein [Paenibacillus albiflavus]
MKQALGMIETIGMTAAIRAADMMIKCAYVEVAGFEKSGAGYVMVLIKGSISSVQAALEIGAEEASRTGQLIAVHAINNPYEGIHPLIPVDRMENDDEEL